MLLFSCAKKETAISWEENTTFTKILESANGKYVMLDFVRNGCSWCLRLDAVTFTDLEVINHVNTNLKAVKMHADSSGVKELIQHYRISGFPTIVIVDSDSIEIDRIIGYLPPEEFLNELQRIQRSENTIADYIKRTKDNPEDFDLWKLLAGKYEDRGDLLSAVEVWESVVEAKIGDQVLVNYKLVELYAHINKDVTGLEEFVVNNLDSEFTPYAFRNIINVQRRNEDIDAEVQTWINFVHYMELKRTQSAGFYNSFAWRMSEVGENLDSALEKIQLGIALVAKDDSSTLAGYMDTEAEVLWKMGNTDEAVEVIDKCIALQPDDKYFKDQKEKFLED
jgi:thioredoxin-related protein